MDAITKPVTTQKPRLNWAGLWNVSFGFFGIQFGFALQNANMSRIFSTLSPDDPHILNKLPALWIAAPLTGLLVQPLIGYLSDRTWLGWLGRRRPYFLGGALCAMAALVMMPLAPGLLAAALLLWLLDASLNTAMEPFRAFVGDVLHPDQHALGYSVQTAFIGAGAVLGSIFPKLLDWAGVTNTAPAGQLPPTVTLAFWVGGAVLSLAVLWTVFTTREHPPGPVGEVVDTAPAGHDARRLLAARGFGAPLGWIVLGLVVAAMVARFGLAQEMYLLGGLLVGYGCLSLIAIRGARAGRVPSMLGAIVGDFAGMPPIMKKLALVQTFSWSALFIMWINTTPVVARYAFSTSDAASAAYQEGANWVNVLFAAYNGVAAVAALVLLPQLARRVGQARTHALALLCGAAGFVGFLLIRSPMWLLLPEIGIGIAWASILSMPYAILASTLPAGKLGVYMGLFNVFIVVPQLLVATLMGSITRAFFPGEPIYTMAFAAAALSIAALTMTGFDRRAMSPARS